jgi:D-beta-D-heptose 7-phosphate kinase/D-beta-D-heptose 1-phosphate adenosyltransferase
MLQADLDAVLITLGEKGMFLARKTGEHLRVTQQARSVYDVTGAGDTVLALLSWALGSGASLEQAVRLANLGAGIVVGRLGASAVSREDLLGAILDSPDAPSAKIVTLADLEVRVRERRGRGERIVFTNGCFDILHPGHVAYLRFARSRGDTLIVAINSDRSVKALKGEERPIQSERERASVVASLEYVDHVVIFDDLTPLDVLGRLRPDVLVKGEDWKEKGVVGRELVESYGGEVSLAPLVPGVSSTEILRRVTRKAGLEEKADTPS